MIRKNGQIFQKNSPKSCQVKKSQNVYNKAQFESPKHLQQTTFETLKVAQLTKNRPIGSPCFQPTKSLWVRPGAYPRVDHLKYASLR
jgi:hypothetical protein